MSKRSAAPRSPSPEFFFDRGLGKNTAARLVDLGWSIHRIVDHFPNDAQEVEDPEWMEYGLQRGWIPLHKDGRIVGNPTERAPVERHRAPMFFLDNQHLHIEEMVRRLHTNQSKIYAIVRRRRQAAACYAVSDRGVFKRWP